MNLLRERLGRNTLALLLSNGGSAILSFLLSIMIGRVLGQGDFGVYATALAWIFPLSLITEFGLGTLITRDVASYQDISHAYLKASISARLIIGGIVLLLTWMFAPLLSQNPQVISGIRIASPLIVILPFYSSFSAIFRAHEVMEPVALLNLGMLLSQVTLTAIALYLGVDVLGILAINTLTSAGQLLVAWIVYRSRFYKPSKLHLSMLAMLKSAAPFAIAAILAAIQARIILILLEGFTTIAVVGSFAAATRFIEAGRLLPHAFFDALFPRLSGLASTPHQFYRLFWRVLLGLTGFGIVSGIILSLLASPLIQVSYGDDFNDAIPVLVILGWSLLPMLLKGGRTLYWYALGKEMYTNIVTAIVIVLQIIVSIWLIPRYGAIGAAWAVLIAESSAAVLLFARRN